MSLSRAASSILMVKQFRRATMRSCYCRRDPALRRNSARRRCGLIQVSLSIITVSYLTSRYIMCSRLTSVVSTILRRIQVRARHRCLRISKVSRRSEPRATSKRSSNSRALSPDSDEPQMSKLRRCRQKCSSGSEWRQETEVVLQQRQVPS